VFVCTYARDEPYLEVIEAARSLGPSVTVHITGDYRRVQHLLPPSPAHLTGFLPETEYLELLSGADLIIDLTCLEDCLVCGAYEAVALEKPLVTSDTTVLRDYFRLGTVYTKHDGRSLAAAITYALAHKNRLAAEMKTLRLELAFNWTRQIDMLRSTLQLSEPDLQSRGTAALYGR
jgi:glycosyltransferase involved in cell wall biosynthesis